MKTVFYLAAFLTLTILILNSCKPKVDYELERQRIESLFNGLYDYFNNNDWEGYSSNYIHDPKLQMIHPGVKSWISGYDEFAKVYEPFFEVDNNVSSVKNDFKIFLSESGETAWGTVEWITRSINTDTIDIPAWSVFVLEKIDGDWKIVLVSLTNFSE